LLEILTQDNRSLMDHLRDVPKTYSTPEIRMHCADAEKFDLVKHVISDFKNRDGSDSYTVTDIDGARVEWDDGWGLVRPSNTQPILVLRFEAESEERLRSMLVVRVVRVVVVIVVLINLGVLPAAGPAALPAEAAPSPVGTVPARFAEHSWPNHSDSRPGWYSRSAR